MKMKKKRERRMSSNVPGILLFTISFISKIRKDNNAPKSPPAKIFNKKKFGIIFINKIISI